MPSLPDFRLETHFSKWEFKARYHLTASDAESMSMRELLALASPSQQAVFDNLWLGYTETFGAPALREAIPATYQRQSAADVLCFAGTILPLDRYMALIYPGLQVDTIVEHEDIIAVCSPELLAGEHPLETPEDIRWHTLIDRPQSTYYRDRANWGRWFKAAGMDKVLCKGRMEVSYESYAIMSAVQCRAMGLRLRTR